MIKVNGNLLGFFERPVSAVLGVVTLTVWAWVIVSAIRGSRVLPPGPEESVRAP